MNAYLMKEIELNFILWAFIKYSSKINQNAFLLAKVR